MTTQIGVCAATMEQELRNLSTFGRFSDPESAKRLDALNALEKAIEAVKELPGWKGSSSTSATALIDQMLTNVKTVRQWVADSNTALAAQDEYIRMRTKAGVAEIEGMPTSVTGPLADFVRSAKPATEWLGPIDPYKLLQDQETQLAQERERRAAAILTEVKNQLISKSAMPAVGLPSISFKGTTWEFPDINAPRPGEYGGPGSRVSVPGGFDGPGSYTPGVNPPTYQPPTVNPPTYQPPTFQPPTYDPPVSDPQPPVNPNDPTRPPHLYIEDPVFRPPVVLPDPNDFIFTPDGPTGTVPTLPDGFTPTTPTSPTGPGGVTGTGPVGSGSFGVPGGAGVAIGGAAAIGGARLGAMGTVGALGNMGMFGGMAPGANGGAPAAAGRGLLGRMPAGGPSAAGGMGARGPMGMAMGMSQNGGTSTGGSRTAGARGGAGAGVRGGAGGAMGMGQNGRGEEKKKPKRKGLGGPIAPQIEDEEQLGPRSEAAGAGGRSED